ncbi:hypothetical protein [Rhodopseudomonas telluris]|uniref:Uncharacterized protein n=1 Tax=Rhodopseudomonas telluris TaxID=644215 RepID=A0ABV6ENT5_9BRAD
MPGTRPTATKAIGDAVAAISHAIRLPPWKSAAAAQIPHEAISCSLSASEAFILAKSTQSSAGCANLSASSALRRQAVHAYYSAATI